MVCPSVAAASSLQEWPTSPRGNRAKILAAEEEADAEVEDLAEAEEAECARHSTFHGPGIDAISYDWYFGVSSRPRGDTKAVDVAARIEQHRPLDRRTVYSE